MSCPLQLCAFLCSPGSQNSCDSSRSSRCLPATGGDPSVCTLELIHRPWPANVSGLSLHHFWWENLGRQLPKTNSQLPSGIYYLGRRMGMENTVGMERVRRLGLLGEWANHYSEHPSVPMRKASLGWKRPFLQGWRWVPGRRCWLGAGGRGMLLLCPPCSCLLQPAAEIFPAAPVGLGMFHKRYWNKTPRFPPE